MEEFRNLGITEPILKAIKDERFEKPTEIQEKAIPQVLEGKDLIAESATGSGKTLVFGAGIIQTSKRRDGVQALVVTPTRELAEQVTNAIKTFSRYKPLQVTAVYGGKPIGPQIKMLTSTDVVVGTPGRLLDHLERGTLRLNRVNTLVLDEADQMLDMGFIEDVERIIQECPAKRQTMLFSATMPYDVIELAKRHMIKPLKVSVETYVDPGKLEQVYYDVQDSMKFSLLTHLLKNERSGLVMVFCNSRRNTEFVAKNLKGSGLDAIAIHGGLTQNKRTRIMDRFNSNKAHVLVCTDVAARGLDIQGVSHVYNYDIPKDTKQYIHRIGRTARAGKDGKAVNIVSRRDYENFSNVLDYHDVEIYPEEMPEVERVKIVRSGPPRHGSRRPSPPRRYGKEYKSSERKPIRWGA